MQLQVQLKLIDLARSHRLVMVLTLLSAIAGCAAGTTAFDVVRAPEMKIAGIRAIKIDTFEAERFCRTSITGPQHDSLAARASDLAFAPDLREYPKFLRKALSNGRFQVTESDNFDARISGMVACDMKLESRAFDPKNREGKLERGYQVERRVTISVKFVVSHKSGESFASNISASKDESQLGDSVAVAVSRLQGTPLFVVDSPLEETADKLFRKVSPWTVREQRRLAGAGSSAIKNGNVAAENDNWPEAVKLWMVALQSSTRADQVAGLVNLAINDERNGSLDRAEKKYQQLYTTTQDKQYERAAAHVRVRRDEEDWLRKRSGDVVNRKRFMTDDLP